MKRYLTTVLFSLFAVLLLLFPTALSAEELKLDVADASALKSSLEKVIGKVVVLRLTNGEDISGTVEAVGPTAVRVGQLTGKEFYSAVILIDRISAVIYRSK